MLEQKGMDVKCVVVMFDTLNRRHLPGYGCDWVKAPNFERLAEKSVQFNQSYVCSMPCMPARRDFHTARPNFLHRSWGPLEPFDDSVPEMLKEAGVYTHLCTDHYHYFEDGGGTYHNRYRSYEFNRGQEGDLWKGVVKGEVEGPEGYAGRGPGSGVYERQNWVNRGYQHEESDWPVAKTFRHGMAFIETNWAEDDWCLTIETFDPHEPFYSCDRYKEAYAEHYEGYRGPFFDWPEYDRVKEGDEAVAHLRYEYASLVSMCDAKLGEVLDTFDRYELWEDTMLVVWTDHGFMLGERDMWAKCWMPFYDEVARTPFYVWDPRCGKKGEVRESLVQPAIDLGPTLLRYFGVEGTKDMLGKDLAEVIENDEVVREAGIFGMHGGHVNVTDGRYVYMRGAAESTNQPLYNYTLMPTHMRGFVGCDVLGEAELVTGFGFMKGCKVLKLAAKGWEHPGVSEQERGTMLFDLAKDAGQEVNIKDEAVESRMVDCLIELMREAEAPSEQYERLGLNNKKTQPID
ncbi:sulfatase [Poriferisphaera corsica]|uniref:sulfatase n=1 Tax=Poriferisphaera corsica TaxID=2528020 RepID=UPI00190B3A1D|nr:sulfatase [Poriferisphaera corsica]